VAHARSERLQAKTGSAVYPVAVPTYEVHFVAQENVQDPAQILIGVTAHGAVAAQVQSDWRDGTLAEYASFPASAVTPAEDLPHVNAVQLAVSMRYIVPFGGLLRGRLAAGETLVISGATGAYGTAAVFLALAMGAHLCQFPIPKSCSMAGRS